MHLVHFDCCVCLETKDQDVQQVQTIADKWIRFECVPAAIIEPFEAVLKHEHNFSPRWDRNTPLMLSNNLDVFADDFADAWYERMKLHDTPVQRRVFCQTKPLGGTQDESVAIDFCNNFLGELGSDRVVECEKCGFWTCFKCRLQPYAPPEDEHFCTPPKPDDSAASFNPETRGKEWQQCPKIDCLVKHSLGSGCNAMRCRFCDTEFCMICGESAAHDSGHWIKQQGCPRWNGLDAANAMSDDSLYGELDIVVEMAMLPPTDPHIPAIAAVGNLQGLLSDRNDMAEISENFDVEIPRLQWAAGGNTTLLTLMNDMSALLHDLTSNLEWAARECTLRGTTVRAPLSDSDPVYEAVESVNFIIRHERLCSTFLKTLRESLGLMALSTSLVLLRHQTNIKWMFARYLRDYQPVVAEPVRLFVNKREAGRTFGARDEDHIDPRA